ncbi:uncharacterized protein LOC143027636 [Oratosquilla oratoria]|uniref:uncharacterized protein LOC143027636 n=1 Tax=Oratosquilla oratoria TaxID=337810 RepID=UPI003F76071C
MPPIKQVSTLYTLALRRYSKHITNVCLYLGFKNLILLKSKDTGGEKHLKVKNYVGTSDSGGSSVGDQGDGKDTSFTDEAKREKKGSLVFREEKHNKKHKTAEEWDGEDSEKWDTLFITDEEKVVLELLGRKLVKEFKSLKGDCAEMVKSFEEEVQSVKQHYTQHIPPPLKNSVFDQVHKYLVDYLPENPKLYFRSEWDIPKVVFDVILDVLYDTDVTCVTFGTKNIILEREDIDGSVSQLLIRYFFRRHLHGVESIEYPSLALLKLETTTLETLTVLDCGQGSHGAPHLVHAVSCSCPHLTHFTMDQVQIFNSKEWVACLHSLIGWKRTRKPGLPIGCRKLQVLCLPVCPSYHLDFPDLPDVFVKILDFMPDLEILTGAPLLSALHWRANRTFSCKSQEPLKLKLFHDKTTYKIIECIFETFDARYWHHILPRVERAEVCLFDRRMTEFLSALKYVSSFTIDNSPYVFPEFSRLPAVLKNFENLKTVNLRTNEISVHSICNFLELFPQCPRLQNLKLRFYVSDSIPASPPSLPVLTALQHLDICFLGDFNMAFLSEIVQKSPNLTSLHIRLYRDTRYKQLQEWLEYEVSHMNNLEVLMVRPTDHSENVLTLPLLETVLSSCPKLKHLGHRRFMSESVRRDLRQMIRECNWDLKIGE